MTFSDILDVAGKIGGILAVLGIGPGVLYVRNRKRKIDAQANLFEGKVDVLYGDALQKLMGPLTERLAQVEHEARTANTELTEVNRRLAEANNTVYDLQSKCDQLEQQLDTANERALSWENRWRETQNLPPVQLPRRKYGR